MDFSLGRVPTLKSIDFSQGGGVHSKEKCLSVSPCSC